MHPDAHPAITELRRGELERLAKSRLFARAGKLRQLVHWLGERAVSGAAETPSEYVVGVEALGKRTDFDPSYDVSVRQLKRRMCVRLVQYYETEGRDSRLRLVCERGFAVRFEAIPARSAAFPSVAVMPLLGDEPGVLTGSLSHALMETGRVQVISRAALQEHHGAAFLIEGEIFHHSGGSWELAARLVDASNGHVLSGLRLDGPGAISRANIRYAAERLVLLFPASTGGR